MRARQDVRDFLNALLSNGVDGRSVARKLSALRHFYKYLLLDRYIKDRSDLNIDTPRQWKVLPKSLAADEVESVLQGPPRAKDDRMSQALGSRPGDAGSVLRRGAACFRSHQREAGRPEAGTGLRAGAGQGRQGTHRAAGTRGAGGRAAISCGTRVRCWRQGSRRRSCLLREEQSASPASECGRW